jgi:hypothetical protein
MSPPLPAFLPISFFYIHIYVVFINVLRRNPKQLKHSTAAPRHVRIRVREFFQTVKYIPPSTTRITFSDFFNLSLDKYDFPPPLTHVTFGYYFNSAIVKFPPALTHLTFGHNFNKALVC